MLERKILSSFFFFFSQLIELFHRYKKKKKKKKQAKYEIFRPKPSTLTLFTWSTVRLVELKGLIKTQLEGAKFTTF